MTSCVIFDIDGTLAHRGDRSPFDYSKVREDSVDKTVADLFNMYKRHTDAIVIIVTGREDLCEGDTVSWLLDKKLYCDQLYMRKEGDNRKDSIVKKEIYDEHIKPNYNVLAVFDDRQQVVDMWREEGLKCLQVAEGNF